MNYRSVALLVMAVQYIFITFGNKLAMNVLVGKNN